jgi:hypothetical protein
MCPVDAGTLQAVRDRRVWMYFCDAFKCVTLDASFKH